MKRCPECRRDYYDESLIYCLDDGNVLVEGPASLNESATAILSVPPAEAGGLGSATDRSESKTAIIQPSDTADPSPKPRGFDTRLLALPMLLAVVLFGGYFGYKYFAPTKQIGSIAVMPFVNDSGNVDLEYLSDGMTDTLIGSLSQLSNLSVKARSSVFRYKGKDTNPQTIGKELSVQAILNGRVVQRGDLLTLSLELIDAATENVIWSEKYDRKQADLVALQSEIARDVSNKLAAKLTGEQTAQIAKSYTQNPEAYRLYLQGRFYWNKRKPDEVAKAVQFFEQAIALDPNYALAYSGIADCYAISDAPIQGPEKEAKLRAAVDKALQLDSTLGQPHAALANLYWGSLEWTKAENEYKTAIQLAPESPSAHQWYAELLTRLGRQDEAIAQIKVARDLDPLSLVVNSDMIYILAMARRYDEAIAQANKTLEMDPTWTYAHWHLTEIYVFKGQLDQALDEEDKALEYSSLPADKLAAAKLDVAKARETYKTSGAEAMWRQRVEVAKKLYAEDGQGANFIAEIYAILGNKDEAFRWTGIAIDKHDDPDLLKVWPSLDPLRGDPRYTALLKRLNLPE